MLPCLWDGVYKRTLAAKRKTGHDGAVVMSSANGQVLRNNDALAV